MKTVGFLPVRAGSKSVPGKNFRRLCGRPLLFWILDELLVVCDEVYVYTDSSEIESKVVSSYRYTPAVKVMQRPEATATDTATSESALLDFCRKTDSEVVVFAQATSPLTEAKYIRKGIEMVLVGYDSSVSVVRQKRFVWEIRDGKGIPCNYDPSARPRRQDFDGFLVENGAFYVSKRSSILQSSCRVSGRTGVVEMAEDTYHEIDEPTDWIVIEELMKQRLRKNKNWSRIELLVLDIDGVLSDGGMYYDDHGEALKRFNTKDGMGLEVARESGIGVAVITSENKGINSKRMEKLGVINLFQGITDKYQVLKHLSDKLGLPLGNIAYVGDDINDEACMLASGLSFAPSNAEEKAKKSADFLLSRKGGSGAVREAVERIIDFNKRIGG